MEHARWIALAYLLALTIAEVVTTLLEPRMGMILYGLVLFALLWHASLSKHTLLRGFLLSLALVPLIRLTSLSLPLSSILFEYWYAVVGIPLLLTAFLVARLNHIKFDKLGLTLQNLPLQIVVGFTGLALGYFEYLILRPEPLVEELSWGLVWQQALILLIFPGFLEEFIFRGLLQTSSIRSIGRIGLVYVAVIYAVLHIGFRSVFIVLFIFAVSIYFGFVVRRSGSILGVTLAHWLANLALFLVIPWIVALRTQPPPVSSNLPAPLNITPACLSIPHPSRDVIESSPLLAGTLLLSNCEHTATIQVEATTTFEAEKPASTWLARHPPGLLYQPWDRNGFLLHPSSWPVLRWTMAIPASLAMVVSGY